MPDEPPSVRQPFRRPESLWRLVDAKCNQLKDSVAAARIPFFLLLLWGFSWFIGNYNHDCGYTTVLVRRYQRTLLEGSRIGYQQALSQVSIKRYYLPELFPKPDSTDARTSQADSSGKELIVGRWHAAAVESLLARSLREQYTHILRQQVDLWKVPVLGIGVPVTVFDLGIVGQAGLVLLLFWFYFAVRRENQAIRSIVELREDAARESPFPSRFVLHPNVTYLEPEHYAYAYNAVAQRFMFLTSSKARPLLLATVAMMLIPLLSSTYQYYTDLRDLFGQPALGGQATIRTIVEAHLWIINVVLTWLCIRVSIQTSLVLNGWYLANRDCWENDWDESRPVVARDVLVDRVRQVAAYLEDSAPDHPSSQASGDKGAE